MKHALLIIAICFVSCLSWAQKGRFKIFKQDSDKRAEITNTKPLKLFYEKASWNLNPAEIERGYLYLRDKNTGELIELHLSETAPSSGVFNYEFAIGTLSTDKIAAEMYSAPPSMLKDSGRKSTMRGLIEDGSIKRKPFLLRVLRSKGQIVDVFDNKEDAIAAYNKYRKQMGLSPESLESESIIQVTNKEKPEKKKVIDTSTLQSLFLANEVDLEANAKKNAELREVLRNLEVKRRQKIQDDAKKWSQLEKNKNQKTAAKQIKTAVRQIKTSDFGGSMENFYKASDLTPFQEDVYEQYGVSLFRDKKYNQAIVVLEISKPTEKRLPEKNFYLGLSHYQLKDYQKAIEYFDKVIATSDKNFASTAAFYKGSALLELNRFDESKEAFQYVLDNSNNPEMDKKAEKFIEYSLDQKTLAEKRSNWYFFDGVLGLIYDDNIIFANDQARDQGTATDESGWRSLVQLSPKVRPYYSDTDEIAIAFDFTNIKSYDEGFGSNPTAETADPTIYSIRVPWTHRGTLSGKGYFFDLAPSYEIINMDLDGTGTETITKSIKVDFNNTLVVNKNWIAKGDWFFSQNDSDIQGDATSADSVAAGLKLSSIFVMNKDLERYLIPEFGYSINDAEGANFKFTRIDLGVTYTTAVFDMFMWNNRFGYYLANYESSRVDNNYTITSGLSARLSAHWNWGLMGSYIINDSTQNQYKKYNIVTTFSFSY